MRRHEQQVSELRTASGPPLRGLRAGGLVSGFLAGNTALVASLVLAGSALGAPGDLDPSFGEDSDGTVAHNLGTTVLEDPDDAAIGGVVRQSDGKLVVAGYSGDDFAVARYETDGSLDASFSEDGLQTTDFGGLDYGHALAIQSDGKIVVAGRADESGTNDWGLARYNTDGSLDTSFSGDGLQTTDFGGGDSAYRVTIQSDQKVVVVGGADRGGGGTDDFGVARYNTDGTPDDSFSGDGKQKTDFGGSDYADGVAIQADDKIVVGGSSGPEGDLDFAIARYDADGTLDDSFSGDGKQTSHVGASDDGGDLAIQPDGKIVLVGEMLGEFNSLFALARYNTDGSLDTSFSGDGLKTTDFAGSSQDGALGVAIQPDGKVVAAGYSGGDFALARYGAGGTLDDSFSGDGKQTTDFGSPSNAFGAVAIQPDGKIVAAGFASGDTSEDFALARYDSDGSLDAGFSGDGLVITGFPDQDVPSNEEGFAVAIQPDDDKIVVAGYTDSGNVAGDVSFGLARFNPDGTPDTSFGSAGTAATDFGHPAFATGVAVQSDGKIVAVGGGDSYEGLHIARYNSNGTPDTSFSGDGKRVDDFGGRAGGAADVAIQPDGKIVCVGWTVVTGGGVDFAVARYDPSDGSLDSSFSGDGLKTAQVGGANSSDYAEGVVIQSDDRIVAVGMGVPDYGDSRFALARFDTNGNLDTSFSGDGKQTTSFSGDSAEADAVELQPDGKIIAVGEVTDAGFGRDFALARYGQGGALDPSFPGDGKQTTDFGDGYDGATGVVIQPDGALVAGGTHADPFGNFDFALARYGPGGALDPSFSGDGKQTTDFAASNDLADGVVIQQDGRLVAGGTTVGDFALARYEGGGTTPPEHTASVTLAGGGMGVAIGPGIDCPGACAETYTDGATVTVEASASGGSAFAGWTGDCSGTGDCELTMGADRNVIATFDPTAKCDGKTATMVGDEGVNKLTGTAGHDVIAGLRGGDILRGLGGNDILCGGNGADKLSGGRGKDRCDGGADHDTASSCEKQSGI